MCGLTHDEPGLGLCQNWCVLFEGAVCFGGARGEPKRETPQFWDSSPLVETPKLQNVLFLAVLVFKATFKRV